MPRLWKHDFLSNTNILKDGVLGCEVVKRWNKWSFGLNGTTSYGAPRRFGYEIWCLRYGELVESAL